VLDAYALMLYSIVDERNNSLHRRTMLPAKLWRARGKPSIQYLGRYELIMTELIAVFDLEGTLCYRGGGLLWREVVKSRFRRGSGIRKIIIHVLGQIILALLYQTRLISNYQARVVGTRKMAALFQGVTEEDLNQLAKLISIKLVERLRPEIYRMVQEHKRQNRRLVLVSGTFQPILEVIGQQFGFQLILGTKLEKKDDCYTGQLSSPICFYEQKSSMLNELIKETHLEVDFSQSYAYGDTMSDRFMLEMVGNPVAAFPDAELRAYAQEHGWKIIG